jgi:hypothetical protein
MPRYASTMGSLNEAVDLVADKADFLQTMYFNSANTDDPTLTADKIVNSMVTLTGQTSAQDVTTATAAEIIALIPDCQVNHSFRFILRNSNTSSGAATLVGGEGVDISVVGTLAQPIATTRSYIARVTSVSEGMEGVTFYAVGQVA